MQIVHRFGVCYYVRFLQCTLCTIYILIMIIIIILYIKLDHTHKKRKTNLSGLRSRCTIP